MYYNSRKPNLSVFRIVLGAVLFVLSVAELPDLSLCAGMGAAMWQLLHHSGRFCLQLSVGKDIIF